jgi:hypothetical protein
MGALDASKRSIAIIQLAGKISENRNSLGKSVMRSFYNCGWQNLYVKLLYTSFIFYPEATFEHLTRQEIDKFLLPPKVLVVVAPVSSVQFDRVFCLIQVY